MLKLVPLKRHSPSNGNITLHYKSKYISHQSAINFNTPKVIKYIIKMTTVIKAYRKVQEERSKQDGL